MSQAGVRVVVMSTPDFGVPTLRAFAAEGYNIVGVVCQPDRPAGRGLQVTEPPVKRVALSLGLPVYQWPSLRSDQARQTLAVLAPDLILVAAYGLYIPDAVASLAARGCLNLHPSLLPRHRGASPVASAILHGDAETGTSIIFIAPEMDTGDILAQERTAIAPDETTGELTARLAELGAGLFVHTVERWLQGEIKPWKQDGALATFSKQLTRDQAQLDWRRPAAMLARQIRAFDPSPGAFTMWQGTQLGVLRAAAWLDWTGAVLPGTVVKLGGGVAVATGRGALQLVTVQAAGRKAMDAAAFANGARGFVGAVLESPSDAAPTWWQE